MEKKKGFTLIEILVVLGLIGLIFLVAIPALTGITRTIRTRQLETKKKVLVSSAEVYAQKNQSLFPEGGGIIQIPVRTLLYYGYINPDTTDNCTESIGCVMNPADNTSMNDDIITIQKVKSVTQAVWGNVNAYKATFYPNGATIKGSAASKITIGCDTSNNTGCTIMPPAIERSGFEIIGWSTNRDDNESLDISKGLELNSDNNGTSYYAITKKEVAVEFDPNGGEFVAGSKTEDNCEYYNTNTSCSVSTDPVATRPGYVVNSKNKWKDGSGDIVNLSALTKSLTAYIQWEQCPANTYAAAGATSCSACPSSHPYSAAGSDSINDCYRYNSTVADNYSYTSCSYSSESEALAACGSNKTDCLAVPCTNVAYYYIANYTIQARRRNNSPYKYDEYVECTTVMRRTTDIPLVTDGNDSSCNYYTALSESGIPTTNTTAYCKSNSSSGNNSPGSSLYNEMHNLQGRCAITSTNGSLGTSTEALCNKSVNTSSNSSDVCNTMVYKMLNNSGNESPNGDCHTRCTLACGLYKDSTHDNLELSNVIIRAGSNELSGAVFFFAGNKNDGGDIFKSCVGGTDSSGNHYSGTPEKCSNKLTGYAAGESRVKLQNCKVTKAAYSTGSSTYKLQYKAVTEQSMPIYYNN